jgi:hypothetical protein
VKGPRYEAAWLPGLEHDIDQDEAVLIGFDWLRQAERKHGGTGVIVMYAKSMASSLPMERASGTWAVVSRRSSSRPYGRGPVLAIWPPDDRTLEFAEQLATGSALCVIPGTQFGIGSWIQRTGAPCLVEGFDVEQHPMLPPDIAESLGHMLFFGGHNNFVGAGEKENAIPRLQKFARRADAPSREQIEDYVRASGQTGASGVVRVGKWYEEILNGHRHRDYRGRVI